MHIQTSIISTTAVVFALSLVSVVFGQEANNDVESEFLERLKDVELTPDQQTRIRQMVAEYGVRIGRAEAEAARTDAQRQARAEAVKNAIAQGKRGADAAVIISAAGALTTQQKAASVRTEQLRQELETRVFELLTRKQIITARKHEATEEAAPNRRIVLRLADDVSDVAAEAKTLLEVTRSAELTALEGVLKQYDFKRTRRLVPDLQSLNGINGSIGRLQRRLKRYWMIDTRDHAEQMKQITTRLSELPEVETAYEQGEFDEPSVDTSDDLHSPRQEYLDAAPRGIDARFAWTQSHGHGALVGIVDIERGWHESHQDLLGKSPELVFGMERAKSERHGTAVLGEVVAVDNSVGVVGIAPSASYVFMASYHKAAANTGVGVADAIISVLPLMNPGDVLLLEVHLKRPVRPGGPRRFLPVEVDDAVFDAIQLAVEEDIIVVEAAGNGGQDLDKYTNSAGKQILNRNSPDFRKSGAILVGCSDARADHDRHRNSNFGSRVDCFAWGSHVTTTGHNGDLSDGNGNINASYTRSFNGTSSAAPIIAGAAMILQGMSKGNSQGQILPHEMQELLADPATGTAHGNRRRGLIGVMPNLQAIITSHSRFQPLPSPE